MLDIKRAILKKLEVIRHPKNSLLLSTSSLLIFGSFSTYLLSTQMDNALVQGFLVNVSAGFFGSAFTLVVLTSFDRSRIRQDLQFQIMLYQEQLRFITNKSTEDINKATDILNRSTRLYKHIDRKNIIRNKEILVLQLQMITYVVNDLQRDIALSEHEELLSDKLTSLAFSLGDKSMIDFVQVQDQTMREQHAKLTRCLTGVQNTEAMLKDALLQLDESLLKHSD